MPHEVTLWALRLEPHLVEAGVDNLQQLCSVGLFPISSQFSQQLVCSCQLLTLRALSRLSVLAESKSLVAQAKLSPLDDLRKFYHFCYFVIPQAKQVNLKWR